MKMRLLVYIFIFILLLISSVSIGYSAFSTNLAISGDAFIRRDSDVRITNLELISKENGGYETYNSTFSKNLTSMFVSLPNTNSSVTYRVTVTNKTSSYFTPGEIKTVINSNSNVNYVIEGIESFGVYQESAYSFTITFTTSSINQDLSLTIQYDFKNISATIWNYSYTGSFQTFKALYNATYKIEAWGTSGGNFSPYKGGRGAFVSGNILLKKDNSLYLYVGGMGSDSLETGGYNGGGSLTKGQKSYGSSGGGATDIRLVSGDWNNESSLRSRIMVAAGGGGANYRSGQYGEGDGGNAGGLTGFSGVSTNHTNSYGWGYGEGGSQVSGGKAIWNAGTAVNEKQIDGAFGQGGGTNVSTVYLTQTGGGSGYYGGGGSSHGGAGGGSSYISGYLGCIAISSASNSSPKCSSSSANSDVSCSYHYSGYKFTNTKMIAGDGTIVSPSGLNEIGHTGDGYVRITLIPYN